MKKTPERLELFGISYWPYGFSKTDHNSVGRDIYIGYTNI